MRNEASIINFDDLLVWFESTGNVFWKMWKGNSKTGSNAIAMNASIDDQTESYLLLEDLIKRQSPNGGERFTILVTEKPKSSHGLTTLFTNGLPQSATVGSIRNGYNINSGVPNISGLSEGGLPGYINNQIGAAVDKVKLEHQILLLKKELAETKELADSKVYSSWKEELAATMVTDPVSFASGFSEVLVAVKGLFGNTSSGQISMAGHSDDVPSESAKKNAPDLSNEKNISDYQQRFVAVSNRISPHIDTVELLEIIADVNDANPAFIPFVKDREKVFNALKFLK